MFHMTNDSGLFRTGAELEADGCYPVAGNRWKKGAIEYGPLYEGKMVQAFDHRAANVVVNSENLHRPAQSVAATLEQHADPGWTPDPQFWIAGAECEAAWPARLGWAIGFKDITSSTNARTMIAAAIPRCGAGNTLPLVLPSQGGVQAGERDKLPLLLANFNCFAFDYVARQKVQSTHLNWYIVEQLPVLPPAAYRRRVGPATAESLIRREVLHLTYTAHDMAAFARDLGHDGAPFPWDEGERRHGRARLDALYFLLYGIGRDDAAYILDTFPIVRERDEAAFGRYLTRDLVLGYMAAFAAGDVDARVAV